MDRFAHILVLIIHLFVSQITSSKAVILILCYLKNLSKNISVRDKGRLTCFVGQSSSGRSIGKIIC